MFMFVLLFFPRTGRAQSSHVWLQAEKIVPEDGLETSDFKQREREPSSECFDINRPVFLGCSDFWPFGKGSDFGLVDSWGSQGFEFMSCFLTPEQNPSDKFNFKQAPCFFLVGSKVRRFHTIPMVD